MSVGWDQVSRNECDECEGVGALARIERDVVARKPTVVTLLFGMNDGRYADFDEPTLGVVVDGAFYFSAGSQGQKFLNQKNPILPADMRDAVILKLPL